LHAKIQIMIEVNKGCQVFKKPKVVSLDDQRLLDLFYIEGFNSFNIINGWKIRSFLDCEKIYYFLSKIEHEIHCIVQFL